MLMKLIKFTFLLLAFLVVGNIQAQEYGAYTGMRIHITSTRIISESKRSIKIGVILANTGRKDVRLHSGLNRKDVVFSFGESFENEKLALYKDIIINQILDFNTTLRAGQLFSPKGLKIKKAWLHEKVAPSKAVMLDPNHLPKESFKPIILDPNDLPEEKAKPIFPKEEKITQTKQKIIPTTPINQPEEIIISKIPKSEEKQIEEHQNPNPKSTPTKVLSPIGELPKPEMGMQCFDLLVENLTVEKNTRKYTILSFDLINNGAGSFTFNRKNPKQENLSIKAFFASIPRLTRGSLIAGGEHFDKLFKEKKFTLGFGEHIKGTIKIPLEKMTKFTRVIILEVDPFSAIHECDKVNNVSTVVWKGN